MNNKSLILGAMLFLGASTMPIHADTISTVKSIAKGVSHPDVLQSIKLDENQGTIVISSIASKLLFNSAWFTIACRGVLAGPLSSREKKLFLGLLTLNSTSLISHLVNISGIAGSYVRILVQRQYLYQQSGTTKAIRNIYWLLLAYVAWQGMALAKEKLWDKDAKEDN